jgi:hypothetical protein
MIAPSLLWGSPSHWTASPTRMAPPATPGPRNRRHSLPVSPQYPAQMGKRGYFVAAPQSLSSISAACPGGLAAERRSLTTSLDGPLRWRHLVLIMALAYAVAVARPIRAQTSPSSSSPQSPSDQQTAANPDDETDSIHPKPSLLTPLKPLPQSAPYLPVTRRQRLRWILTNSIGPSHLIGGVFSAGFGTALDRPREYGPHWGGFGERYGIRLTGIVPGNIMEAEIGTLWGEDPRYFRVPDQALGARVRNVVMQTFKARRRDGTYAPAYARFIAEPGNNFLSNLWRADSEANTHDAILRTGEGFAGRMAANAFAEFWPDVNRRLFHRRD